MGIETKWWVLVEEEPIDLDQTRVFELKAGVVLDGRTGEVLGSYAEVANGVDLTMVEKDGDSEIIEFRMTQQTLSQADGFKMFTPPFDPDATGFSVDFTSAKLEAFRATLPPIETETVDQTFDRQDHEEARGFYPTYGFAMRDGPYVRELHERNQRGESASGGTVASFALS